jgi:hypothetical protein
VLIAVLSLRFHIVAVGTEECERSIAKSAMNPSKKVWEAYLRKALGPRYRPLKSHTLQVLLHMAWHGMAWHVIQYLNLLYITHPACIIPFNA